jgi:tRNA threonylcarbamoyladenosine biosynthesis protein TsaE
MTSTRADELLRLVLPPDPAATEALGEALGARLRKGDVLALVGELGAGKTTMARGIARGLGVDDPDGVASPTYLLVVEHPGPVPLRHADAYLPQKLAGFVADGGLDWLFDPGSATVLEWADRIGPAVPEHALWCELAVAGDGGRVAVFRCAAAARAPWLARLVGIDENRVPP